ncbi:20438_t:CDS:2 [Entrophospora sp. SA101]|nr:20438_t:CDS:2 [Entrophospora sp. SA101]
MSRIGNPEIDKFLQKSQLRAIYPHEVLEFIPYENMTNKEKQQKHLNLFNHYVQGLNELKKDLETIKQIIDFEEKYNQTNITLSGHSTKYNLASEISGCNQNLNEYAQLVSELRTIETEAFKQLKATQCAYCKRKNLVNAYVYETNSVTGVKTVFCDKCCDTHLLKKNQIILAYNSLILERKNLKVPNFTYEELEAAQAREELENYVQQKIAEIKQIRESLNQEQNNCPQCHQPLTGE